jgi:hypothetical protein|tara:strand:+ start:471 stop:1067 length:597 start_codon:yes stop_codon:yes gene_type:complete
MSKKLLREFFALCDGGICEDLLTESEKNFVAEGGMILSGICQKAKTPNGNNRVYSHEVLNREVENYQNVIRQNRALGELDHPDSSVVSLEKVSHMVISLWMEGNDVYGKIKVLDTPAGNILRALVDSGVQVGISSRGLGSVRDQGGKTYVEDDFQLICFDMVSEPSTPGAFMMREYKEPVNENKDDKINRLLTDILGD